MTYPKIFWRDRFHQGVWRGGEAVIPPYGSRANPFWGPEGKAPGSSKDLALWNHLLLIQIYLPQPVMKLVQHNLFANYLSLCILLKICWTKKLFLAPSLGAQTGIPDSKSLWIRVWYGGHSVQKVWAPPSKDNPLPYAHPLLVSFFQTPTFGNKLFW